MRCSTSANTSSAIVHVPSQPLRCGRTREMLRVLIPAYIILGHQVPHTSATPLAPRDGRHGTCVGEIEDHDGEMVVLAQRQGGAIHDAYPHVQGAHIADLRKLARSGMLHGIGLVDA